MCPDTGRGIRVLHDRDALDDPRAGKIRVDQFLRAVPGVGVATCKKLMVEIGICETLRTGNLRPSGQITANGQTSPLTSHRTSTSTPGPGWMRF